MNQYEEMLQDAADRGIIVVDDYDFSNTKLKGLYCDGVVAISKDIDTDAERCCILAEETGHHETTVGDIIDVSNPWNRKQEHQARMYGYNLKVGLIGIVQAFEHGCQNKYDAAEYLEVPVDYLMKVIDAYREKYGHYTMLDNYMIYFVPSLAVMRLD